MTTLPVTSARRPPASGLIKQLVKHGLTTWTGPLDGSGPSAEPTLVTSPTPTIRQTRRREGSKIGSSPWSWKIWPAVRRSLDLCLEENAGLRCPVLVEEKDNDEPRVGRRMKATVAMRHRVLRTPYLSNLLRILPRILIMTSYYHYKLPRLQ